MSKKEKLIKKFKALNKYLSFDEFNLILKYYWFTKLKTNAWSHMKWRNCSINANFRAPKKDPMKVVYIKEFLDFMNNNFINK